MNKIEMNIWVLMGYFTTMFIAGGVMAYSVAPEQVIVEKEVEVEKIVEIPATNQDVYDYCSQETFRMLYSSFDGDPLPGTTPENTKAMIDDCFNKLTAN